MESKAEQQISDGLPFYKEVLVALLVGGLLGPLVGWFIGTFATFFAVAASAQRSIQERVCLENRFARILSAQWSIK
jgi:hypothetical protein